MIMASRMAETMIVDRFSVIQCNMEITPFGEYQLNASALIAQLGSFLIGLEEHVDHTGEDNDGSDQADDVQAAGEGVAELVDHQGNEVSKAALIADGEPCPLRVVHLTLDRADGGKARGAQEVKNKEGIACDAGKVHGKILIHRAVAAAIEDTERTVKIRHGIFIFRVMEATVACQLPQPSGIKIQAIRLPILARIE